MDNLTFLLVHYKTPDLTSTCVRSIERFTKGRYNILIINNGPPDVFTKKTKWPIRNFSPKRVGSDAHGQALNYGLQFVNTKYTCVIDSDCGALSDGWILEISKHLKGNTMLIGAKSGRKPVGSDLTLISASLMFFPTKIAKKLGADFTPNMKKNIDTGGKVTLLFNKHGLDAHPFQHRSCGKVECKVLTGIRCAEYYEGNKILWGHFGRGTSGQKKRCVYADEKRKWITTFNKRMDV